ncbi:hypothetical protein K2173_027882 [Erythroxylum novogranatense]|uniref:DC1 domain-containing protein n=1 Tax=Erythroxylum novogranatense TaxID=1862640 RepID=A0AAV8U0G3_9ROSI|nr:hypothetical protein K2173_027882 [Erythroxylum novogranatense]
MSLKKTTSFPRKKLGSTSMELLDSPPHRNTNVPKKSYLIEFPTSPNPVGEQILHSGHQQHPLSQFELHDSYKCSGCKEYGSGKCFACQQCEFQLHEFCALAPPALKAHPFHMQHQLFFSSKPVKKSKCDVCGKATKGYNFRCNPCGYQMHPCCAMLSTEINISIHQHPLKILSLALNGDPGFVCGVCNRKRLGRVYRCCVCDYDLHAVCAKEMVNGKGPKKSNMLVTAVRLASQVVGEFIGGLVDGLGQGVGEVLIQSVTRGGEGRRPVNNYHN